MAQSSAEDSRPTPIIGSEPERDAALIPSDELQVGVNMAQLSDEHRGPPAIMGSEPERDAASIPSDELQVGVNMAQPRQTIQSPNRQYKALTGYTITLMNIYIYIYPY